MTIHAQSLLDICEEMSGGSAYLGSNLLKKANWTYDDEGNMVIVNPDGSRRLVPTLTELDGTPLDASRGSVHADSAEECSESRAYPMNVAKVGNELVLKSSGGGKLNNLVLAWAGKYEFETISSTELRTSLDNPTLAKKKVGMLSSKVDLTFSGDAAKYETSNYNKLG